MSDASPATASCDASRRVALRAPAPGAELFCPPSAEALRLLRWFPGLLSPERGTGGLGARLLRDFLVAPFTQLTFVSFDLQMFLFDVLHVSRIARVGHLVGMTAANLFGIAVGAALLGPWFAGLAAVVLLGWYFAVARVRRLWAWWALMVPIVGAIAVGAAALAEVLGVAQLLVGVVIAGLVLDFSHLGESHLPPRAGHPYRWIRVREYAFGTPGDRPRGADLAERLVRLAVFPFVGFCDELWASPRLLPYNFLRLMFAAGYRPELKRELDERAARALASGQPALDYVGIGGGTFLTLARD